MIAAVSLMTASPAVAQSNSFQCDGGGNQAVVNACGARWEAANIRAHLLVESNGGYSTSCLTKTANLLDQLATKWLSKNAFTAFKGSWPCGKEPSIAKVDDGALAQVCPNGVWSYDNKGKVACPSGATVAKVVVNAPPTPEPPIPMESYESSIHDLAAYDAVLDYKGSSHHMIQQATMNSCRLAVTKEDQWSSVKFSESAQVNLQDLNGAVHFLEDHDQGNVIIWLFTKNSLPLVAYVTSNTTTTAKTTQGKNIRILVPPDVNREMAEATLVGAIKRCSGAPTDALQNAPPRAAPTLNVAGTWFGRGTPDGTYTIFQSGNVVTWSAVSNDGVTWGNDFLGSLNGNLISGTYSDKPGYPARNVGNLVLRVVDACHLSLDSTNISDYATTVWTKINC